MKKPITKVLKEGIFEIIETQTKLQDTAKNKQTELGSNKWLNPIDEFGKMEKGRVL